MSQSTDKYVNITLNVPLWNIEKNRSYLCCRTSEATLRKFFKTHLGDEYKANIKALGQRLVVTIE